MYIVYNDTSSLTDNKRIREHFVGTPKNARQIFFSSHSPKIIIKTDTVIKEDSLR